MDITNEEADQLYDRIERQYQLDQRQPISLLRLLINQQSFQKSVANFFYFSQLLQDKRVQTTIAPTGLPVCVPLAASGRRSKTPDMFGGKANESFLSNDDALPGDDDAEHPQAFTGSHTVMLQLREQDWKELVELFSLPEKKSRGRKTAHVLLDSQEC